MSISRTILILIFLLPSVTLAESFYCAGVEPEVITNANNQTRVRCEAEDGSFLDWVEDDPTGATISVVGELFSWPIPDRVWFNGIPTVTQDLQDSGGGDSAGMDQVELAEFLAFGMVGVSVLLGFASLVRFF